MSGLNSKVKKGKKSKVSEISCQVPKVRTITAAKTISSHGKWWDASSNVIPVWSYPFDLTIMIEGFAGNLFSICSAICRSYCCPNTNECCVEQPAELMPCKSERTRTVRGMETSIVTVALGVDSHTQVHEWWPASRSPFCEAFTCQQSYCSHCQPLG